MTLIPSSMRMTSSSMKMLSWITRLMAYLLYYTMAIPIKMSNCVELHSLMVPQMMLCPAWANLDIVCNQMMRPAPLIVSNCNHMTMMMWPVFPLCIIVDLFIKLCNKWCPATTLHKWRWGRWFRVWLNHVHGCMLLVAICFATCQLNLTTFWQLQG